MDGFQSGPIVYRPRGPGGQGGSWPRNVNSDFKQSSKSLCDISCWKVNQMTTKTTNRLKKAVKKKKDAK